MNFPILNKVHKSRSVVSIEIVFDEGNIIKEIRSGMFSFKSDRFKEETPLSKQQSINEVIEKHGIDSAYVVTFSGKGILTKKIPEYNPELDVVSQAIPNLSIDDFYFYTATSKKGIWISLIGRKVIDDILKQFKEMKIRVVQCFFGPLLLTPSSIHMLGIKEKRLITPEYVVDIDTDDSFSFQPNTTTEQSNIKVIDKTYSGSYLLSMVGALSYLLGTCNPYDPTSEYVITSRKEEKYKNLFNSILLLGVSLIFILAFSSFVLGSYLTDKYNNVISLQANRVEMEKEISQVNNQIDSKKEFYSAIGLESSTSYSYYLDRLAKLVPAKITLLEMSINPVQGKLKNGKRIQIQKNVIRISGLVSDDEILSDWVQELSNVNWIQLVEITGYEPLKRETSHQFDLKLEL